MRINHESSQPGVPVTNAIAERNNQDILNGARCALAIAGLPACCWPYAAPHYCMMVNTTFEDGVESPWSLTHKRVEFPGLSIPFGAEVMFKPSGTRPADLPGKWEGDSVLGIFAG